MLISNSSFFADAYLVEERASKYYKNFVDTFIFYQAIFEGSGDLNSILTLPYPLYKDIILAQVEEEKRKKKVMDSKLGKGAGKVFKNKRK